MYSFYDEEQHKVSLNFSSRTAWLPAQLKILDIYISHTKDMEYKIKNWEYFLK